jgi:hypothetical protein
MDESGPVAFGSKNAFVSIVWVEGVGRLCFVCLPAMTSFGWGEQGGVVAFVKIQYFNLFWKLRGHVFRPQNFMKLTLQ